MAGRVRIPEGKESYQISICVCCAGHVVDGTSSEQFNYTTQNQILNFNKRYLRQVTFVEPPPPFPVGSKCNVRYCTF